MLKLILRLVALMLILSPLQLACADEEIYRVDFSQQPDGDARKWLQSKGFQFLLDIDSLSLIFNHGLLEIKTTESIAAIVGIKFSENEYLNNIEKVIIDWGVNKFPQGADWENGNNRLAIGMLFILGTEKLSSGLPFGINAAPYFLGPFIGEKEQLNKRYLGALYQQGGRYYCVANKQSAAEVITEFNIDRIFQKEFNKPTPALTAFAFQVNTNNTSDGAFAYIKRIVFYKK